jgi:hypothetical protein
MTLDGEDAGTERLLFAMLVGAVFGAAFGGTVLGDTTQGVVTGIVGGSVVALVFPTETAKISERVQDLLDETDD